MDAYERAALEAANHARAMLGVERAERLEAGRVGAWECPVARTVRAGTELECRATPERIEVCDGEQTPLVRTEPGPVAARFMGRFDGHHFPHLEVAG